LCVGLELGKVEDTGAKEVSIDWCVHNITCYRLHQAKQTLCGVTTHAPHMTLLNLFR